MKTYCEAWDKLFTTERQQTSYHYMYMQKRVWRK